MRRKFDKVNPLVYFVDKIISRNQIISYHCFMRRETLISSMPFLVEGRVIITIEYED